MQVLDGYSFVHRIYVQEQRCRVLWSEKACKRPCGVNKFPSRIQARVSVRCVEGTADCMAFCHLFWGERSIVIVPAIEDNKLRASGISGADEKFAWSGQANSRRFELYCMPHVKIAVRETSSESNIVM